MKYALALLILAMAPVLAEDTAVILKQQADLCSAAVKKNDFETLAGLTHPRVVEQMGGKEAMVRELTDTFDRLKANGVAVADSLSKEPAPPAKVGGWLVAMVPTEVVMETPDKRLRIFSEMVGISEDEGKKWVFVDAGSMTPEEFFKMFPELRDKITLTPAKPTAVEPL